MTIPNSPQFRFVRELPEIPKEFHDFAWEVTTQPHLDVHMIKNVDGYDIAYTIPGHLHFDTNSKPSAAPVTCAGRDYCPDATVALRSLLAYAHFKKTVQNN